MTYPDDIGEKVNRIEKIRSRVQRTIDTHRMIAAGDSILVAVSGGPDSMAMLDLLVGLTDVLKIRLGIAHIDHNLRGDEGQVGRASCRERVCHRV